MWSTSPGQPGRRGVLRHRSGRSGSDNWSAYSYEGPEFGDTSLTIHASDGVHDPAAVQAAGRGFDVFGVDELSTGISVDQLNPQTQERLIGG